MTATGTLCWAQRVRGLLGANRGKSSLASDFAVRWVGGCVTHSVGRPRDVQSGSTAKDEFRVVVRSAATVTL